MLSRSPVVAVAVVYALALAATFFGREVVLQVHLLYVVDLPATPYFVPEHAILLYLVTPVVLLASVAVLLAPGILLLMASRTPRPATVMLMHGLVLSLVIHAVSTSLVKALGSTSSTAFFGAVAASGILALAAFAMRARQGRAAGFPAEPIDRIRVAFSALLALLLVVGLLPVLFWMDINPDGLEALTSGRSLDEHFLPRLPTGELAGIGLGMTTMAFPIHWFVALFGPIEAAARLPLVVYVPVLFAGLVAVAEARRPRALSALEVATVGLAVCAFTVTLVYNDTYHPYSADPSSPANIDILAATLMLCTLEAFISQRRGWLIGTAVLWHLTRPTAILVLALLAGASLLLAPKSERKAWVLPLITAGAACVAVGAAYQMVVTPLLESGTAQSAGSILARIRYLRFDDWGRIWFVLLPTGILPMLMLVRTWRVDSIGGVLALVSLGYFLFFYCLAFTALHHFAPVMLLPVAIYWRAMTRQPACLPLIGVTAAGALVGLFLSMPNTFALDRSIRQLGSRTQYEVGDYDGGYERWREAFAHKHLLDALFVPWVQLANPAEVRVSAPWPQVHYAFRAARAPDGPTYRVLPRDWNAPAGALRVAGNDQVVLYVTDPERWYRDQMNPPRTNFRSDYYDIPLTTLLQAHGLAAKTYTLDLKTLLTRGQLK